MYRYDENFVQTVMVVTIVLSAAFALLFLTVFHLFEGFALYRLSKNRGYQRAWLAFIPVVNSWVLGGIADHIGLCAGKKELLAGNLSGHMQFLVGVPFDLHDTAVLLDLGCAPDLAPKREHRVSVYLRPASGEPGLPGGIGAVADPDPAGISAAGSHGLLLEQHLPGLRRKQRNAVSDPVPDQRPAPGTGRACALLPVCGSEQALRIPLLGQPASVISASAPVLPPTEVTSPNIRNQPSLNLPPDFERGLIAYAGKAARTASSRSSRIL